MTPKPIDSARAQPAGSSTLKYATLFGGRRAFARHDRSHRHRRAAPTMRPPFATVFEDPQPNRAAGAPRRRRSPHRPTGGPRSPRAPAGARPTTAPARLARNARRPFAPLHLPAELSAIGAGAHPLRRPCRKWSASTPAFHRAPPRRSHNASRSHARLFDAGIRPLTGFHGPCPTSSSSSSLDQKPVLRRAVIRAPRQTARSMGRGAQRPPPSTPRWPSTPTAGLVMGTRSRAIWIRGCSPICSTSAATTRRSLERGLVQPRGPACSRSPRPRPICKRFFGPARPRPARSAGRSRSSATRRRKWIGALAATLGGNRRAWSSPAASARHAPEVRRGICAGPRPPRHFARRFAKTRRARSIISADPSQCQVRGHCHQRKSA